MCFIKREIQNFILKFREISTWIETVLCRVHGMKFDEKSFFCEICAIFFFFFFFFF